VKHEEITKALNVLMPETKWTLSGDNFEDIVWLDETESKPTLEQVEAEIANPTPKPELTVIEKLASVGLSIEELKEALSQ
jgi:hypothetical protein